MKSQFTAWKRISTKTITRKELARLSEQMQAEGRRLVLTNGCFDLLHIGHVRYLKEARSLGEALAIGLNSDQSARRLKGPSRPVNSEEERAEMLAALESVDYVVIFDEDTAEELVAEIRPAVYVKGGDYATDPADPRFPPEGHLVREYGGSVHIVDYVPGRSTTELINRLAGERSHSA